MTLLKNSQESIDDSYITINNNYIEGVAWYDEVSKGEAYLINEFCRKRGLPILF